MGLGSPLAPLKTPDLILWSMILGFKLTHSTQPEASIKVL